MTTLFLRIWVSEFMIRNLLCLVGGLVYLEKFEVFVLFEDTHPIKFIVNYTSDFIETYQRYVLFVFLLGDCL